MRYRAEDGQAGFDHVFGRNQPFLINSPEAVAQAIRTRLLLRTREWFIDLTAGTDYEQIVGYSTQDTRDLILRQRILDTPGVQELIEYRSVLGADRVFSVTARVATIYGTTQITVEF